MTAGVPSASTQYFQIASPQPHAETEAAGIPSLAAESEGGASGATVVPSVEVPALGPATNTDDVSNIPNERWKCLLDVPSFDPREGAGAPWELGLRFDVWKNKSSPWHRPCILSLLITSSCASSVLRKGMICRRRVSSFQRYSRFQGFRRCSSRGW